MKAQREALPLLELEEPPPTPNLDAILAELKLPDAVANSLRLTEEARDPVRWAERQYIKYLMSQMPPRTDLLCPLCSKADCEWMR